MVAVRASTLPVMRSERVQAPEVEGNREVSGAFSDIMYNKESTIWSFLREQEGIFFKGS